MDKVNVKELSQVNDELMDLGIELKGLREMVNTIALSVNCLTVIEDEEAKFHRLAAPYPTIVSALDTVIKKLDGFTNDLDLIDTDISKRLMVEA